MGIKLLLLFGGQFMDALKKLKQLKK